MRFSPVKKLAVAFAAAFFSLSSPSLAQTGSQKTQTQLNAEVNLLWPDQTQGAITPAGARQTLLDIIASVDTNSLNAQTSAYALQASDCNKIITLGGSAFYTLTVGTATGFSSNCNVVILNIDTGRGKKMAVNGVTFPNNSILWPLQSFTLKNENNVWVIVNAPGRWKLAGPVVFNVDSGAADNSADGLATGTANAFKTIAGALGVVSQVIDASQQAVAITPKCAGGPPVTYTENLSLPQIVGAFVGGGLGSNNPVLVGDTTTPTNCVLSGQLFAGGFGNDWVVRGFQFTSGATCILADAGAWVRIGEANFATCTNQHINVENRATVETMSNYTISGPAAQHVFSVNQGFFLCASVTATVTGTPAFSSEFVFASRNSTQVWVGCSVSGAATGKRFTVTTGSGVDTNGGGVNFFPGNSPGTSANPGWYN